jgi:flagellar biosynthesis protein FlhG
MSRILSVASGKGGTGKTSLSVNLSLALGRMGRKVCLLDADLGLSNVDVLLGISPTLTLEHVLFEGVPMEKAIFPVAPGLDVVPGGSGVARLADLSREARTTLAGEFAKLSGYDYLVVDGSPGISSQVISLCLACPELLVVVNPDPASITDAYALLKVLSENGLRRSPYLVVNRVKSAEAADDIFSRLRGAMAKYLKMDARYLGHIPQDAHMSAAAARQRPLVDLYPSSAAGRALLALAKNLDEAKLPQGVGQADPASFMAGAVIRMRESSPLGKRKEPPAQALQALDAAIKLAGVLDKATGTDHEQVVVRLKSLLLKVRSCMEPGTPSVRNAGAAPAPVQVAVISSDNSIGEILSESLGSSGLAVNPRGGGRADAAVVYWRGDQAGLSSRLAELGDVGYVYVRSVASKDVPKFSIAPSEVMDMPFKLEDLAVAVRRCAGKSAGSR